MMTESEHGVVQTVAAVGGPVGSLTHARVAVQQIVVGEQRLTGTVDIGLEELEGRLEAALMKVFINSTLNAPVLMKRQ